MNGDRSLISNVVDKDDSYCTFGYDNKGFTKGYGCLKENNVVIDNISIVNGLKHNLFSINLFRDKGYDVLFRKEKCLITNRKDEKLALKRVRKGNLFIDDLASTSSSEVNCLY